MGEKVPAPDKPLPDLYASMDHMGHGGGSMSGMDHSAHGGASSGAMDHSKMDHSKMKGMDHSKMDHSQHGSGKAAAKDPHASHGKNNSAKLLTAPIDFTTQSDAMLKQNAASRDLISPTSGPVLETLSVDNLTALAPTTFPKDAKIHDLKLVLGGDMERYVWHINGKAIQEDRLIFINKGEIIRFTFKNDTMMHHPMHLHGHFFRVLNEQGDKSPSKHTVDVPPHGTRTIEFFANEPGQWMLHCHNLYHMKTGMARVVRYNDFKLTPEMAEHDKNDPHLYEHLYTYSRLEAASNHARAQFKLMRTWDELDLELESANIDGKNFSFEKAWETEGYVVYRRWFSNFFNINLGSDFYNEEAFGVAGVGYMLPLLIETQVLINHEGRFRFDLEKRFQWTKNIFSDAEFTWRPDWGGERDSEFEISLMYGPSWNWAVGLMLTEKSLGFGAHVQF